jgi:hypothetical protein
LARPDRDFQLFTTMAPTHKNKKKDKRKKPIRKEEVLAIKITEMKKEIRALEREYYDARSAIILR